MRPFNQDSRFKIIAEFAKRKSNNNATEVAQNGGRFNCAVKCTQCVYDRRKVYCVTFDLFKDFITSTICLRDVSFSKFCMRFKP